MDDPFEFFDDMEPADGAYLDYGTFGVPDRLPDLDIDVDQLVVSDAWPMIATESPPERPCTPCADSASPLCQLALPAPQQHSVGGAVAADLFGLPMRDESADSYEYETALRSISSRLIIPPRSDSTPVAIVGREFANHAPDCADPIYFAQLAYPASAHGVDSTRRTDANGLPVLFAFHFPFEILWYARFDLFPLHDCRRQQYMTERRTLMRRCRAIIDARLRAYEYPTVMRYARRIPDEQARTYVTDFLTWHYLRSGFDVKEKREGKQSSKSSRPSKLRGVR